MREMGCAAFALLLVAAAPSSRQAAYDAAQAALDKGDWAVAAAGFAPLLPSGEGPLAGSSAIIGARRAIALDRLGRYDEAEVLARRAVAGLPSSSTDDVAELWAVAGDGARDRYAADEAVVAYGHAKTLAMASGDASLRIRAAGGIAYATMTVDPARAEAEMAALLDDPAFVKMLNRKTLAMIEQLRARAALNRGDLPTAKVWIDKAVAHDGGSTGTTVGLIDVALRGDAAIIAQRRGSFEDAREYLTFSGAGHLKSLDWIGTVEGALPVCGADGDIRPDDYAVVGLSIDTDGSVKTAYPVYASRPGAIGTAFAKAVRSWHWKSTDVAKLAPLWRAEFRLELRCETRPEPEKLRAPFVRAALERPSSPAAEAVELYQAANDVRSGPRRILEGRRADRFAERVPGFVASHPDTPEAAWLQLEWALTLESAGQFAKASPLVETVLRTPEAALPGDDPLRQVARLHRALIARQIGGPVAVDDGGVNAESCSLIDTRPIPTNLQIVSGQFPIEAMRWRFEGYVRVAYDIGADGRPSGIRTILAYPPFVFGPATERAATAFRYAAPTIDGKPAGCVGQTQSVAYRVGT